MNNKSTREQMEKIIFVRNLQNKLMNLDNRQLVGFNKLVNGDIEGIKYIFKEDEINNFLEQEKDFSIDEKLQDYKDELIKYIRG